MVSYPLKFTWRFESHARLKTNSSYGLWIVES